MAVASRIISSMRMTLSRRKKGQVAYMRLANGIVIDKQATFGRLRFSALRREVFELNEDGTPSDVVKERTYDLKSKTQRRMIQVSIPASTPLRDYAYNAEVDIVNPVANTVANATFGNNAEADWYIKADDIVLVKPEQAGASSSGQPTQPRKDGQPDKKA